jgi:CrcB protein
MLGCVVLALCWNLQHAATGIGGVVGCQVLQGVQDGFCGTLTTVSTWVGEMQALRRLRAYVYGGVSVGVGLGFVVVIMGSLRWTRGFAEPACSI